jgi:glucose-1-phosphate adenylyltransferase
MAYRFDGYFSRICSMDTFYKANMNLLSTSNREKLFLSNRPIYTKVRDNPPAKFAIGAKVNNSLIGDGCIIEGTVENSVLFRGVKVGKGAVIKNSILMQDTNVGSKCEISCVISDKDVKIGDMRMLTGSQNYPLYLGKGAVI